MNYNQVTTMSSIHTIEINHDFKFYDYETLVEYVLDHCNTEAKKGGRIEIKALASAGIRVSLQPTCQGGIAYVVLNLQKLLAPNYKASDIIDPTDANLSAIKAQLKRLLREIGLPSNLELYRPTEVDLCGQVFERTNSRAREYERLVGKALVPTGGERIPFFDPRRDKTENRQCARDWFKLKFHDRAVIIYDKKSQAMRERLTGCKEVSKGAARIEIQLYRNALQKCEKETGLCGWALICWLAQNSADLLIDELEKLFFSGVYLKKSELNDAINTSNYKKPVRELMLRYVKLAKRYGETKAAHKIIKKQDWSRSEFIRFRRRFEKLGIQPTPLRKNYHESWLEPPQDCFLQTCKVSKNYDSSGFFQLQRRSYVP